MQTISTSVVKAGVFLSKALNKAAQLEAKFADMDKTEELDMPEVIENCHSKLLLFHLANTRLLYIQELKSQSDFYQKRSKLQHHCDI
ncbi:hypothetical protein DPMN_142675 [Dreissena polymorpha]|uniref:Uncharacterized protein n=1 Tax=Dreissena polymorpha TaxID=45954 RepID=A0A9D4GEV1_DREPO|nr:hypothetical protein DPMN_142675 [Dreissena polymorpha]